MNNSPVAWKETDSKSATGACIPIHGSRIKAAFQHNPEESPVRILLATDAASEAIDLQSYCHRLVHYEIPWNLNRMEQRNGRMDPHGQKHDVEIFHFVGRGFRSASADGRAKPGNPEADLEFQIRAAKDVTLAPGNMMKKSLRQF